MCRTKSCSVRVMHVPETLASATFQSRSAEALTSMVGHACSSLEIDTHIHTHAYLYIYICI